ncbi:Collagen binding domain-containing protein [Pseudobutyrivibrio sp. OR37]|uniref:collagen binding domain-containing protein n=1 Tax=Pseudobutyrivibrio sp. OR37 TaxID=1798186 RepID=UPI0008E1AFBD|nr:collagen binding domain-containing protein [Pseudobutyrivibrio sp. OR37]SFH79134.1 Collagen binding domain-containing protein [Pseudobutyrivibrio sp. OR37]
MKTRITAMIMGLFLLINVLAPSFVSSAEESTNSQETSNANPKVAVSVTYQDGTSIQSGDISKDTVFKAVYAFDEMEINTDGTALRQGHVYDLPAILGIGQFNLTEEEKISLKLKNSDTELGVITVKPNGDKADLSFELTTDMEGTISDAYFEVELRLNPEDTSSQRTISFPDGCSYDFNIREYMDVAPSIKLTAEKLNDDTADWKATINRGSKQEFGADTKVVIKLSADEEYVEGSANIGGQKLDAIYDKSKHQLICDVASFLNSEGDVVINYQTKVVYKVTAAQIAANSTKLQVKVWDEAALEEDDVIDKASANVSFTKDCNKWFSKEAVGDIDDEGVQQWKIVVDSNDCDFNNVHLYDLLPTESEMGLVQGSVYVNDKKAKVAIAQNDSYTFSVDLGKLSSEKKVIEYKTRIKNYSDYLKRNHSTKPANKAWFTYEYDFGDGAATYTGATATATAEVNLKSGVEKKGISYDTATHRILWQIAVNQEYQQLTNVSVKDIIPSNQSYVEGSISSITYTDSKGETSTKEASVEYDGNNALVVDLGNLSGQKAVFTLMTELKADAVEIWSDNAVNNIVNTVEMSASEINEVQKDSASVSYKSEVISTSISNYNYNEHTADIVITVDKNKMPMSSIIVVDQLKYENYEFQVVSDLTVNGVKKNYVINKDGNLVLHLDDITEAGEGAIQTITFKVKVSGDVYKLINNKNFTIANVAALQTKDIIKKASGYVDCKSDDMSIYNSILAKTGKGDAKEGIASYTIMVNRARIPVAKGFTLKDTLGSSLQLDEESIQVYDCAIDDKSGKVMEETPVAKNMYKVKVSTEADKDILEIKLPAGDHVYKVTYNAFIVDSKLTDCNNTVEIIDAGFDNISGQQFDVKSYFEAGASFRPRKSRTKEDKAKADNEGAVKEKSVNSDEESIIKEKSIVAYADADLSTDSENAQNASSRFAKTGGFVGTLAAYAAGLVLIIAGLYLVLSKKKTNEK